jgi:hypothetical protein
MLTWRECCVGKHCHDAKSICSTKEFFSPPPPSNEYVAGTILELVGLMLGSLFQRSKLVIGNSLRTKKHTTFYFTSGSVTGFSIGDVNFVVSSSVRKYSLKSRSDISSWSRGIPTRYGLGGWGSILGRGKKFVFTPQHPDSLWGTASPLSSGYRRTLPRG